MKKVKRKKEGLDLPGDIINEQGDAILKVFTHENKVIYRYSHKRFKDEKLNRITKTSWRIKDA